MTKPQDLSPYIIEATRTLPPGIELLVESSKAEGFSFVERLYTEWQDGSNTFARPGEAFFTARTQDSLVGVCGLNCDPYAADQSVGRIRHLYVLPVHRRRAVGRLLVEACLAAASEHFTSVRLRTFNPAADQFYLALGFQRSEEDSATHIMELT